MHQSWVLYPPAIPLLFYFAYGVADRYFHLDNNKNLVKKTLFMVMGTIVLVSYGVKLYGYYKLSI